MKTIKCPHCQQLVQVNVTAAKPPQRRKFAWSEVDWSKSNMEIAREMRTQHTQVWIARQRYAPETVIQQRIYDWSEVDWNKSNAEIAEELGAKYSTVSAKRNVFGFKRPPKAVREGKSPPKQKETAE